MEKYWSDPERTKIYEMVDRYFDHPVVYKQRNETSSSWSLYAVQIRCFLLKEKRFLVVIMPMDSDPIGTSRPLNTMRWVSFQARTLSETVFPNLPVHTYQPKQMPPFTTKLVSPKRSKTITIYHVEDYKDCKISMLHTRNLEYEYSSEGMFNSAMETFQTIISFE